MRYRLFDIDRPRAKPRILMHVWDAGPSDDGDTTDHVRLKCNRCGHETEWQLMRRVEAKYGVPCPKCNAEDSRR